MMSPCLSSPIETSLNHSASGSSACGRGVSSWRSRRSAKKGPYRSGRIAREPKPRQLLERGPAVDGAVDLDSIPTDE